MKHDNHPLYGKLCSLYYDLTENYASQKEVDFYAGFIESDQRVLEPMSGSGRLQIPLLQRGYLVDGVDSSFNMLERCRKRCADFKINPQLYEQRLEKISLEHTYATVIIAKGSFQLIADKAIALEALQRLRAHMHIGSTLLIDIFVPDASLDGACSTDRIKIDEHQEIQFSAQYTFDENRKRVDVPCSYELFVNGIGTAKEDELMQFVWYTNSEFKELLSRAGFDMLHIYETSFYDNETSHIVHAQAKPI